MKHILDPKTGQYLWRCPECGELIRLCSETAISLAKQAGRCQGCRARATFNQSPGLVALFLDFWGRNNAWPQSNSWMDALSESGFSLLHKVYTTVGMPGPRSSSADNWIV